VGEWMDGWAGCVVLVKAKVNGGDGRGLEMGMCGSAERTERDGAVHDKDRVAGQRNLETGCTACCCASGSCKRVLLLCKRVLQAGLAAVQAGLASGSCKGVLLLCKGVLQGQLPRFEGV
jgi:hypothetical protein